MKNSFNLLQVSKNLIDCPSVTPKNAGAIEVLEKELKKLGFRCQKIKFSDNFEFDLRLSDHSLRKSLLFVGFTAVIYGKNKSPQP